MTEQEEHAAIREMVKRRIEQYARAEIEVTLEDIHIKQADTALLIFTQEEAYRGKTVDLAEKIDKVWVASYETSTFGVQVLVSYSAWSEEEIGSGFDVETWWPLLRKDDTCTNS